jgi:hypothetical protein
MSALSPLDITWQLDKEHLTRTVEVSFDVEEAVVLVVFVVVVVVVSSFVSVFSVVVVVVVDAAISLLSVAASVAVANGDAAATRLSWTVSALIQSLHSSHTNGTDVTPATRPRCDESARCIVMCRHKRFGAFSGTNS